MQVTNQLDWHNTISQVHARVQLTITRMTASFSRFLLTVALVSCGRGASIEGDVYLVMASGDVKPGAGVTVHVLANPDLIDNEIDELCRSANRERDTIITRAAAQRDSLQQARARAQEQVSRLQRDLRRIEDSLTFDHPAYNAALARLKAARAAATTSLQSMPDLTPSLDQLPRLRQRVITELHTLLLRYEVGRVKAGMDARYRFNGLKPGAYYLYAETSIFEKPYEWFARVVVTAREQVTRHLDNESLDAGELYCGFR